MTETELGRRIDEFIAQSRSAIVADIGALVAVDSVEGEALPGAPYGAGPREALDVALAIARRLGLDAHDFEGHMGWAELAGRESGHIATITHVDIVPCGEGWSGDALVMREREGWIIGRGTEDDKGPSVLCLYAAKFLMDLGVPLRYGLRVLLGCNEETGMKDVGQYLAHNEMPLFCFSPDADFPVCNGEKGLYAGDFVSAPLNGNLLAFSSGGASNVIPERAHCVVKADAAALVGTEHIVITAQDGAVRLDARGIGGHAAHPAGTLNAIGLLVDYVLENNLCDEDERVYLSLLQRLHSNSDGSGINIACSDEVFTPLTCIGGVISLEGGRLRQNINIRFPTATTADKLTADLLLAAQSAGACFEKDSSREPFYIPADAPDIQILLATCNEVMGTDAKPFTMGGGTYARHFARGVSFGPNVKGAPRPDFVGSVHGADEAANVEALLTALKIYILSLWRLQDVDFS